MVVIPPGQPTEWTRPADRLSAGYAGYDVSIEVPAPEVGDNPMVGRPPVRRRHYDHENDVLVVAVGGKDQAGAPA
jgi:hypothetical protein